MIGLDIIRDINPDLLVYMCIGIGMIFSLFLTETLGITAGGIIVPGYIALYLNHPILVATTFIVSIIVYILIQLLGKIILIYGKRRLIFALLLGFLIGYVVQFPLSEYLDKELYVIGNIIPGLIANWMDKQGVLRTICTVVITACVTNLFILNLIVYGIIF